MSNDEYLGLQPCDIFYECYYGEVSGTLAAKSSSCGKTSYGTFCEFDSIHDVFRFSQYYDFVELKKKDEQHSQLHDVENNRGNLFVNHVNKCAHPSCLNEVLTEHECHALRRTSLKSPIESFTAKYNQQAIGAYYGRYTRSHREWSKFTVSERKTPPNATVPYGAISYPSIRQCLNYPSLNKKRFYGVLGIGTGLVATEFGFDNITENSTFLDNYFYPGILNMDGRDYYTMYGLEHPRIYHNSKLMGMFGRGISFLHTNDPTNLDYIESTNPKVLHTSRQTDHVVFGKPASPLYYYFHNGEILQPKQKISEVNYDNYPESWVNEYSTVEMFFDNQNPGSEVRWPDIDTPTFVP